MGCHHSTSVLSVEGVNLPLNQQALETAATLSCLIPVKEQGKTSLSVHYHFLPFLSQSALEKVTNIIISRVLHGFLTSPHEPLNKQIKLLQNFPRYVKRKIPQTFSVCLRTATLCLVGTCSLCLPAKIMSPFHVIYFPRLRRSSWFQALVHVCPLKLMDM